MKFLILGPFSVVGHGPVPAFVTGKQAALLAELLAAESAPVPADDLRAELWRQELPDNPERALRSQVTRLRHRLEEWDPDGPERLVFQPPGYLLRLGPQDTDAGGFLLLLAEAARNRDLPDHRAALLARALELWRGAPLTGLPLGPTGLALSHRLTETRLRAVHDLGECLLEANRPGEAIPHLERATQDEPYDERLADLLMVALYRTGRTAAALDVYRTVRHRMVDELGIEPGPELRARMTEVLRNSAPGPRPVRVPLTCPESPQALPCGACAAVRRVSRTAGH